MGLRGNTLLAYVAGIIDGEGNIGLHKVGGCNEHPYYALKISVGNTNAWLISFLKMQFGGNIYQRKYDNPHHKDCWVWELHAKGAYILLNLILPYLQIKRPQAKLAIQFQKRRKTYKRFNLQARIWDEADKICMANYNKRGKQEVRK